MDERLARALDGTIDAPPMAAALAPGTLAWPALVARVLALVAPHVAVAPPDVERLCLADAVRAVLPEYDPAFTERANTVESFARTLSVLRAHEVSREALDAALVATGDRDESARTRLRILAAVLDDHDRRLRRAGLVAGDAAESAAAKALGTAHGRLPRELGVDGTLRVWHLASLPPARVAFLTALARWLSAHGATLDAHVVCEPRRMKLPLTLDRALRAFEAEENTRLELSYGLRDPSAPPAAPPIARWVNALATGGRQPDAAQAAGAASSITLAEAQGPDEEARFVAARVERWMRAGVGAHEIAVVLRRTTEDNIETLGRCLDDARIPWIDTRDAPLLASPVARALLGLPRVVARGCEREDVLRALAVLQGNAPRGNEPAPWRVADALRAMDVESLFDTRLPELCARARKRGTSVAVLAAVEALARDLWQLAQDGTAAEHVARLELIALRAGGDGRFLEESRAVVSSAGFDAGAHAILRALARDERGVAAAAELLRDLPAVAKAAGREGRMSAGEFGELVLDLARVRSLGPRRRPHGGAVEIVEARDAVGRDFAAVVVPGMHEGGFPARRDDEALWGDAERLAVGRALGRPVERTSAREEETLLLLAVMASAREALAVSHAWHDAGGRVLAPSPFFGDLRRTAGVTVERVGRDPLARSRRVPPRGPERTLRHQAGLPEEAAAALPATTREALRSVRARAAVERSRQEFFARRGGGAGRYTGRLDHDPHLVERLRLAEWAGPRRPLAVTTLERAARCGYKAFASEVLRIEERVDEAETLDDKGRGHLLHKLLESGQDALRDTVGGPAEARRAAIAQALDEAGAEFSEHESRLNAALLDADLRAVRRQVEAWLERRMSDPDGWQMVESEVAFGPRKKWPALEVPVEGGETVVIHGRIDGVERAGRNVRVVEFKSGRGDGFRKRLQDAALDTQFQMVVYAAALERARRAGVIDGDPDTLDGVYVGFRDMSEHGLRDALAKPRRKGPAVDVQALVREGADGGGALGDSVRRVVLPLRQGHFEPRPRDCDFCQFRSLCRVETHDGDDDGDGAEGPR
ncbi:MAG: PD-(D/E)XK nuclease family protein [Polyangiales bacterium]